jgi:cyclase
MSDIYPFKSKHFRLEQLADGVYGCIHAEGGWAISNAGIIDLGDRTLVYDTFLSLEAAQDLLNAAEGLTGRPVHAVINGHPHNDHIWGNQVFSADVDIISTMRTRDLIETEGPLEVQDFQAVSQQRLETNEALWKNENDESRRAILNYYITYYQAIIATLPNLKLRLPNVTFTGELTFSGSKRSAKLIPYDRAHSGSDAILHLPDDDIFFMGDILFIDVHPYLSDGDPGKIQNILAQVRELKPVILVPGHGPVGSFSALDWMDGYINTLNGIAREAIKKGVTLEEISQIPMPREYEHLMFPSFYPANLKFLYQRQLTK